MYGGRCIDTTLLILCTLIYPELNLNKTTTDCRKEFLTVNLVFLFVFSSDLIEPNWKKGTGYYLAWPCI